MSELVVIEQLVPADVFKSGGGDPIVDRIREEVLAVDRDISTEDGRKNVASLAYKVARSKTLLDEMGKTFASDLKQKVKAIDSERSRIWDALESLQKEVRQPLTEFEEKEKARIARHEADLLEIENAGIFTSQNWINLSVEAMQDRLAEIQKEGKADRQEFATRFQKSIEDAGAHISSAILKRKNHDAEQTELERLRQADAERQQRERDEKIKAEAAEKARLEAEAKAKSEAEAAEKAARAEKEAAERQAREAEERAAKAERDRIEAEARAAREKTEAAERAEKEKQEAIQRERDRAEAERRAEESAAAKREADQKHRAKINTAALHAFVAAGLTDEHAKMAVEAIAKRHIPHVNISY